MKTSREQFEAEFRKVNASDPRCEWLLHMYNHGTDEEPEIDYYSLAARDAWKWWQASLQCIEVDIASHSEFEIEHMISPKEDGYASGWIDGRNYAAKQVSDAGIKIKGA